jgi:serine/threonine protein kinase
MTERPVVGSKTTQSLCAQCGSSLSSSEGTEEFCLTCLLHTALGRVDLDRARRPRRFDQYELVNGIDGEPVELGRGAMGVTYKAFDTNLRCEVALKVIHPRDLADETSRARFLSEARAAAQLRHRNIASVFHLGSKRDEYFYAMELVEGQTIEEWVRHKGPIDCPIALDIALQITRALIATGTRQFVHRDVKPSNVMLCTEADGAIVAKLIDFGLVRDVTDQSAGGSPVRTGFIGTPHFASPEQFAGETTDARSDIFSLGVTFWFMLTGKVPFDGTREEIQRQQLSGALPLEQLKGIPRTVVDLIKRMLEPDPAKRPQSPAALKEQLNSSIATIDDAKQKQRRRFAYSALAAAVIITCILAASYILQRKSVSSAASEVVPAKSIAVLPFQNLSGDPDNAYFGNGIQEEILTRLASIADLKVISRTSTQQYQSKPGNLREIAKQLGVANILEGSVQKTADEVRVNVQLINAQTDSHLWADTYDRKLTDILGVESEIAKRIAESLQAKLSPSESHGLASTRTHDTEAYDLFLRGQYEFHQAQNDGVVGAYDRAEAFYRQALARDPNFPEAAAELARSRLWQHWEGPPLAPAELEEVKSIIDRALALAPNSPEAHLALGAFFYWGHRQYEMALTEFNRTLELQPNNAWARLYCAEVYRRRGEWERSLADSQQAQELEPRDAQIPAEIGSTYVTLRLWKEAERAELRALAIDPHNATAALFLVITRLNATGDVGFARRTFDGFPEDIKSSLTLLEPVSNSQGGDLFTDIIEMPVYLDVMERRFTDAFQALEKQVANDELEHIEQLAGCAAIRVLAGQTEAAKSAGEEARPLLEARLRARPDDTFAMTEVSWVYLALGRNADALRLSKQAADSISIEKDAMAGPSFQFALAQIEARAGAPEEAIKRLRRLLSIPTGRFVSIALLKIDPVWDPIRDRPDFQQLLSGPEQIGPN